MGDPWVSIGLGAGLGGAYGLAAYLVLLALGSSRREVEDRFMKVFLGGMLLRMLGLLIAVGLILYLVQPQVMPFGAALVVALLISILLEVWGALHHVRGYSRNEPLS